MKKKFTPASICAQRAWGTMPLGVKKELRKTLPDRDKDGVPNGFDCRPKNKRKQEELNEEDTKYLKSKPKIKLGKVISMDGFFGDFYSIEGNDRLGIKVPKCESDNPIYGHNITNCDRCGKRADIVDEGKICHQYRLNDKPLTSATRMVSIERHGRKCVGLVRPLVGVGDARNADQLTDEQLEMIRKKLTELSRQGIELTDGIQCGFTGSGRVLQFDLGYVFKGTVDSAFEANRDNWISFLSKAGKFYGKRINVGDLRLELQIAKHEKNSAEIRRVSREFELIDKVLKQYGDIVR
jgi:hypothetical protein